MSLKCHSGLLRDISLMLTDASDHDVIIQVGENQNTKEFRAHSNILKARSTYFKSALSAEWVNKKDNLIEFKKPNIDPTIFEIILNYIYKGEVELKKQSCEDILELIVASDELLLGELFKELQDYLIKDRSVWIRNNLSLVLYTVSALPSCKKLQDYCTLEDPKLFITSKYFQSLDKDTLYQLLKRDDFLIEEVIAWDYLIKWGIEQTPSLRSENSDRIKWNNENYKALKETLNQFIPLIRFSEMSSADFFDKVRPFKAVIPHNIYEKFMEFHMKGTLPVNTDTLPPRIGTINIESKIIKPKLAYIIANWIDRKKAKTVRSKHSQYKFTLLYRSSLDGLNISSFRNKCGNQGPRLILIKPQSSWDALPPPQRDSWDNPSPLPIDSWDVPPPSRESWDVSPTRDSSWDALPPPSSGSWSAPPPRDSWVPSRDSWDTAPPSSSNSWGGPPSPTRDSWDVPTPRNNSWDAPPPRNNSWDAPPPRNNSWDAPPPRNNSWDAPIASQKISAQNSTEIYGEYCSDTNYQGDITKNFTFSFANDEDVRNMKVYYMNYNDVHKSIKRDFNLGNYFRMNGQFVEVRNLRYNDDDNVINSNVMMVFPMEIEVFLVNNQIVK